MSSTLFPDSQPASGALISACGRYRYLLTRTWDATLPALCWLMLNPSTADADTDDPTIRRVAGFSKVFGFGGCRVLNLYALRATDPRELWKADDPVGPENDRHVLDHTAGEFVIAGYGAGAPDRREREVLDLIRPSALAVECLGLTGKGKPRHPLYLRGDAARRPFYLSGGAK